MRGVNPTSQKLRNNEHQKYQVHPFHYQIYRSATRIESLETKYGGERFDRSNVRKLSR